VTPTAAEFTVHETDVLVIGGGLAALRAALSAREAGARVVVAVKRKLGRSGSSAITSGGYAVAWPELDPLDDADKHYVDTIVGGAWVNDRDMARVLVDEAPARLQELFALGAQFRTVDGRYHLSPSGDHRRPRVLVPEHMRGTDMTLPLQAAVVAAGVDVLENVVVTELLRDDEQIAGAVCIQRDRAVAHVVRAKSVVLAAGGAGRMFPVTSNPIDVRGGGYALAIRAGAELRDMEFIQFYPWRLIQPFGNTRVPLQPSTFVYGAKLYNRDGERFMERYDPVKMEAATRDVSARGIHDQIRLGLDVEGGVLVDLSDVADEQFRGDNSKVLEALPKGTDYRSVRFILAPEAHFVMGGVSVDLNGQSNLKGLFSCGENAGGVHGGNRLNSNAVPETQVFGHRAGIAATHVARERSFARIDDQRLTHWRKRLEGVEANGARPADEFMSLFEEQRNAIGVGLGIVRNRSGLERLLRELERVREGVAAATQRRLVDLHAALELEDMCEVGTACSVSALLREESRGAHFREDHQHTDPGWVKTVVYRDGAASTRPIRRDPGEASWELADAGQDVSASEEFVE